jgi:hypothetical protein
MSNIALGRGGDWHEEQIIAVKNVTEQCFYKALLMVFTRIVVINVAIEWIVY